jgi:hypothetical protein
VKQVARQCSSALVNFQKQRETRGMRRHKAAELTMH